MEKEIPGESSNFIGTTPNLQAKGGSVGGGSPGSVGGAVGKPSGLLGSNSSGEILLTTLLELCNEYESECDNSTGNATAGGIGANGTSESGLNIFEYYEVETLTFMWILLLFIVIGNSAVLAGLMFTKTQRKSRMNFFIMHLALADLSVGLVNVSTDIIWKMTLGQWYLGNVACKIVKYCQVVVIYAANYVLVALSIDRYDAITHPLKFSGSWRRARLLIATAWGLSFTFAIPILFLFHEQDIPIHPGGEIVKQCWLEMGATEWQAYVTTFSFAIFIIPAFIITICYTIMVHTIWTQSRILTPQGKKKKNGILRRATCMNSNKMDNKNKMDPLFDDDSRRASSRGLIPKAKIKSVKMTFVIVFVFICCSSPYIVFSVLQVYHYVPKTQTMISLSTFFTSLCPLNSAANPLIYCLFSTHMCRNLRKYKAVNWIVQKLCPRLGKASPTTGNKRRFGPGGALHQDVSQKTRTDFTSLTDSLMRSDRKPGQSSMTRFSSGAKKPLESASSFSKEVKFQAVHRNGGGLSGCGPSSGSS